MIGKKKIKKGKLKNNKQEKKNKQFYTYWDKTH